RWCRVGSARLLRLIVSDFSFSSATARWDPHRFPTRRSSDLLFREMQKNKVQMAIAIDEYGGTDGIVTIEDLVEEIVGNIFDEYEDRKSTRLNSSHAKSSYAVSCLKEKIDPQQQARRVRGRTQ